MAPGDLATRSGVSQATISRVERGHPGSLTLTTLRRIAGALDVKVDLVARWRAGDLDRLLNAKHSQLHESVARWFADELPAWVLAPEVSYSIYRERGVVDIVAWHPGRRAILVIELKTDIVDVNQLDREGRGEGAPDPHDRPRPWLESAHHLDVGYRRRRQDQPRPIGGAPIRPPRRVPDRWPSRPRLARGPGRRGRGVSPAGRSSRPARSRRRGGSAGMTRRVADLRHPQPGRAEEGRARSGLRRTLRPWASSSGRPGSTTRIGAGRSTRASSSRAIDWRSTPSTSTRSSSTSRSIGCRRRRRSAGGATRCPTGSCSR